MTKALAIVALGMAIVALIVSIPSDWMIVGPGETGVPLVEPVEWTPSADGSVPVPTLATNDIPGDIYVVAQEPQHQSVEELWSDIMSKGSNKVYHVMMNHVEYAFWVSFENSSEYIMRLYPEQQMTDGAYAPQTQGDAE